MPLNGDIEWAIARVRTPTADDLGQFSSGERKAYSAMPDSRRAEWGSARQLCRRVVHRWIMRRSSEPLCPDWFEIRHRTNGQPYVQFLTGGRQWPALEVSLAHCTSFVTAAVTGSGAIGVDIEPDRTFSELMVEYITSHSERKQLKCSAMSRDHGMAVFWCLKEAAVKSIGIGLRLRPLQMVQVVVDWRRGVADVCIQHCGLIGKGVFRRLHGVTWAAVTFPWTRTCHSSES